MFPEWLSGPQLLFAGGNFSPELLRQCALGFLGLSAGGVIAAGIFAFLAIIGVFVRLIGVTHTARHVLLYETCMIAGGVWGNLMDLYAVPMPLGMLLRRLGETAGAAADWMPSQVFGQCVLGIYGLTIGVFVGCLVMSLAETLKALPVLNRRIRLAVGIQYVILAIALGKAAGAAVYFWYGL